MENKKFICDGKEETCLSCPLSDCVRESGNGTYDGYEVKCVFNRREYYRAYYYAHRETILANRKRYNARPEDKEKNRARNKAYYEAHKEKLIAYSREHRREKRRLAMGNME